MKFLTTLLLAVLLTASAARAQWTTSNYALSSGWNGVWLAGDASYTTVADLFAAYPAVTEVWRWNPNPDQIQFTQTPAAPTVSSDEWTVWKRNDPTEQKLGRMIGNSSYLIRCSAAASISIKQRVQPPSSTWLVSGANLLGFPSVAGAGAPTMSSYFATFPSAATTILSPTSKIYKYIGGELSAANPLQVAPGAEKLDSSKAYWIQTPLVGNFTAPVEYELPSISGLAFGRTISSMTAGVTNRSTASITLTVSLESSEPAPAGQPGVTGDVPITRRIFNSSTNAFEETPIAGSFTVTIPGSSHVNLNFGINRGALTGNSSAYYASILRLRDSANLSDVRLPISAQTATTAGLWVCRARVTDVNSTTASPGTTTSQPFPLMFLAHVDSAGTARLLSQVFVGKLISAGNPLGISIREDKVFAASKSNVEPRRYFAPQMPLVPFIAGTGAFGSSISWRITIPFSDPTNPFVHTFHPDHDNLDATFTTPLGNGKESYTVERTCVFTFTSSSPDGRAVLGWGTTTLGGTYAESLAGLNNRPLRVAGSFTMTRISEIADIDLTPP